jgi:PEP-CTERM/exosortase A-associated glycosyltransferase
MLIQHVFDHSLPLQSGYVYRSLGILAAQRAMGWQTAHLTSPRHNAGTPPVETVDGWEIHRTAKPAGRLAGRPVAGELIEIRAVARRLQQIVAQRRPDILHAHSPILTGLAALRVAKRARLPLVYEVRALWEDAAVDLGTSRAGGLRYRATRTLETWLLRRADAVVTLCDSMRRELAARGVPEDRLAVVPNAVDVAAFSRPRARDEALARRLDLEGRLVLGFVGSFYHYEGMDLLIRALPAIRAALPQATLLLVGGGPEAERLQALVGQLGLGDAVRLVGRVPHDQVRAYYDLVQLLVYPRRRMRLTDLVTPLKPLEAMAERRLVVASDVGGHRELIRDGETGYLFPADDVAALARRVVEAARDTDRHGAIREAGRRFVETERNWAASAAHYAPLYERLLRQGSRRLSGRERRRSGLQRQSG